MVHCIETGSTGVPGSVSKLTEHQNNYVLIGGEMHHTIKTYEQPDEVGILLPLGF